MARYYIDPIPHRDETDLILDQIRQRRAQQNDHLIDLFLDDEPYENDNTLKRLTLEEQEIYMECTIGFLERCGIDEDEFYEQSTRTN